jgi:hypothetical protein
LLLKYSREIEYLEGKSSQPYAEAYVDHFWEWCGEKLGPGYKGILQSNSVSPSGRFDRLGKGSFVDIADAYYQAHDEFRENLDSVWHSEIPDIARRHEYDTSEEMLNDIGSKQVIETFYFIYDGHDMMLPGDRQGVDVDAYKYHIKSWVFESDRIEHDDEKPSAESLAEAWVRWMGKEILSTERPIAHPDEDERLSTDSVPTIDEIAEWCREMWESHNKFRGHVKNKWNKELDDGEDGLGSGENLNRIDADRKEKSEKREGQQNIGSFGQ